MKYCITDHGTFKRVLKTKAVILKLSHNENLLTFFPVCLKNNYNKRKSYLNIFIIFIIFSLL